MITTEDFFEKYKHCCKPDDKVSGNQSMSIKCIEGEASKLYIFGKNDFKPSDEKSHYIYIECWYKTSFYLKHVYKNFNLTCLTNTKSHENVNEKILYIPHDISCQSDIFKIVNIENKFRGITSSTFPPYKRMNLIEGNEYFTIQTDYEVAASQKTADLNKLKFVRGKNTLHLNSIDLNFVFNQSLFGGIFSESEGGCFASSEYLCAGLPVLSTFCEGGRECRYNDGNSIMCKGTVEDVLDKSKLMFEMCLEGKFNREEIRENFLKDRQPQIVKFKELLREKLESIKLTRYKHDEIINDLLSLRYISR